MGRQEGRGNHESLVNRKVLLHDRKRHSTCSTCCPWCVAPVGGVGWGCGIPVLALCSLLPSQPGSGQEVPSPPLPYPQKGPGTRHTPPIPLGKGPGTSEQYTHPSGGPRISQRGCATPKGGAPTYCLPNFSQKLHEKE